MDCYDCRHSQYSSNMATNVVHSFCSVQSFQAEKLFNDVEEVKPNIIHCFV